MIIPEIACSSALVIIIEIFGQKAYIIANG